MDSIYNANYCQQTGEYYQDFDWDDFVAKLFSHPPCDPFTFRFEFLDGNLKGNDQNKIISLLGGMLIKGVRLKYNKEIAQLTQTEIDDVQKYYHSLGYQVKYSIEKTHQTDPITHVEIPINKFHIDFQPYPRSYDKYNRPEKIDM
jgi:hypothetical protein